MDEGDILVKLADASYRQLPSVDGWSRDNELSNQNRSVYSKDGKAIVSYRGTNLKDPKVRWDDLGTDILLGLGLTGLSSRFKNARKTADLTTQKYGKDNVSLVGHSLGGSQAAATSRATGLKGVGLNAGYSPLEALRKRTYSNFKNITVEGDPVSYFGRNLRRANNTTIKAKTKNPHSLSNFV